MGPSTARPDASGTRRQYLRASCLAVVAVAGCAALATVGCEGPTYSRYGAIVTDAGSGPDRGGPPGSGGAVAGTGSGGQTGSGGAPIGSGGSGSAGAPATGGRAATGGASASGGAPGTGGANTGGAATGGRGTGGAGTGGAATGGANTGGAATGGRGTGGAGTGGAPADPATYNFETNTQGWAAAGTTAITSIARDTTRRYAGTASLAATLAATSDSTHQIEAFPNPTVPAGAKVTAHVYIPSGSTVDWVQLYLQEGGPNYTWTGTGTTFTAGAWTTLTVTAPTSGNPIASVGFQVHLTGAWNGTLYLDSVDW